jgi:hypothetical protein
MADTYGMLQTPSLAMRLMLSTSALRTTPAQRSDIEISVRVILKE